MGVSGCGKSEIGQRLATCLSCAYVEGDDHHPDANVQKMSAGIALQDEDRRDWLLNLQAQIRGARESDASLVLSCSSLKRRYRDLLRAGDPDLIFVHLSGSRELIAARMQARPGHFMPLALLDSQFRDLEPLQADERGIAIDIDAMPQQMIDQVLQRFGAKANNERKNP